jgi:hypothetical protein
LLVESVKSVCPHCGEVIELLIDTSVPTQEYIEDCQVCCCPMLIKAEVVSQDDTLDDETLDYETLDYKTLDYETLDYKIRLEVVGDI